MIKIPVYSLDGEIIRWEEIEEVTPAPPEPTPDEQRDLLLAQLYENQLLMLNGMNDLVKI